MLRGLRFWLTYNNSANMKQKSNKTKQKGLFPW